MDKIAIFWVGPNIDIPQYLVQSIQATYGTIPHEIYHLTNNVTPSIKGVHHTMRYNLPPEIMTARLKACKEFTANDDGMIYFCDADTLIVNRLNLHHLTHNIYLCQRPDSENFFIPTGHPQYINRPELTGQRFSVTMPYLACFMAVRNGYNFFNNLYDICRHAHRDYQLWYGDQYALKVETDKMPPDEFTILPPENSIIARTIITKTQLQQIKNSTINIIHFKGPKSKSYIKDSLQHYLAITPTQ